MENFESLANLLRVLGDPARLRLLATLDQGELSVREITQVTGYSQPRVSRHLRVLSEAQLLKKTRDQNEIYYRTEIDEDHLCLVKEVLGSIIENDSVRTKDRKNLIAILAKRKIRAEKLLAHMGVRPFSQPEINEVGVALESLLRKHIPGYDNDSTLGDLLDIGTGTGCMLQLFGSRARRIIAIDQSRDMRLIARATVLSHGLASCTVQEGDMYNLTFPKGHFDIITIDRVLGAANDPLRVIAESRRVVKEGGHLMFVETSNIQESNPTLIEHIKSSGFHLLDLKPTKKGTAMVALAARISGIQSSIRKNHDQ